MQKAIHLGTDKLKPLPVYTDHPDEQVHNGNLSRSEARPRTSLDSNRRLGGCG